MSDKPDHLQDLFKALGDSTRRPIMDLLAQHGSLTVTEIASHFPNLVRSGISKHLMELRRLNIVFDVKKGRQRYYAINSETMKKLLHPWVLKYEKYWDDRLEKLKSVAETKMKELTKNEGKEE